MKPQEKNMQNHRRQLLKMIAGGTASAPLVNAGLLTAGASLAGRAAAATPIKNVIFVYIPGGTPSGSGVSINPDPATFTLKSASAPLEPVKQECVFFAKTYVEGGVGQGIPQTALGALTRAPKTIDLALGDALGGDTVFSSIQLGVVSGDTSISAVNNWTKTAVIKDPSRVFELLRTGQASSNPELQNQYKQLEINLKAVQQLQQQLGSFANARLQANQDAILQLRAESTGGNYPPGCDLSQQAWPAEAINPNDGNNFTRLWQLQTGNAITAIKCGLTHVVTLLMGSDDEDFVIPGFNYTLAQAANAFPSNREYTAFRAYFSQQLAYLIQQLQTTTDINGAPLLDSTLVVQVSSMGDTSINTLDNAPFMFAGGGGAIHRQQVVTAPLHTQVLDTVALAMGVYGTIPAYSAAGPIAGVVV